jgi:acetyltransferase-like isoleucine patch superfamily enzyme
MGGVECKIGNNVMMGSDVKLITIEHGYKIKDIPMQKQKSIYSPIIIEDDVWLGDGVKVISGSKPLKIARGIIVGAGSIVTKSLDTEYGIYAGVPAKLIKKRFENEI